MLKDCGFVTQLGYSCVPTVAVEAMAKCFHPSQSTRNKGLNGDHEDLTTPLFEVKSYAYTSTFHV